MICNNQNHSIFSSLKSRNSNKALYLCEKHYYHYNKITGVMPGFEIINAFVIPAAIYKETDAFYNTCHIL